MEVPDNNGRPQTQPSTPREVNSDDLLQGGKMVLIRHAGEQYRLVVTRNNKLILQK